MQYTTGNWADKSNTGCLYAPRYEEDSLLIGKKRPRSLRPLGLASLLVREGNEGRLPDTCFRLHTTRCT